MKARREDRMGATGVPEELSVQVAVSAIQHVTIKTHHREEICLLSGRPEGINLPAELRFGALAEGVSEELNSQRHLINDVIVQGRSLVVDAPAAVGKGELAALHQLVDDVMDDFRLALPPPLEVVHLHLDELPVGVLVQGGHHVAEQRVHVLVGIAVGRGEPSDVVVAVADDVQLQFAGVVRLRTRRIAAGEGGAY